MTSLANKEIQCSVPGCPNLGVTDERGDLPAGWDYRLAESPEDSEVVLLPACPEHSTLIFKRP
jgi:hypothetical protein